jgi:hypothetical protein
MPPQTVCQTVPCILPASSTLHAPRDSRKLYRKHYRDLLSPGFPGVTWRLQAGLAESIALGLGRSLKGLPRITRNASAAAQAYETSAVGRPHAVAASGSAAETGSPRIGARSGRIRISARSGLLVRISGRYMSDRRVAGLCSCLCRAQRARGSPVVFDHSCELGCRRWRHEACFRLPPGHLTHSARFKHVRGGDRAGPDRDGFVLDEARGKHLWRVVGSRNQKLVDGMHENVSLPGAK